MKRTARLFVLIAWAISLCTLFVQPAAAQQSTDPDRPRNVILFIADGFGPGIGQMSSDYSRIVLNRTLNYDGIRVGSVHTHSANRHVTDSAAGATAYATGHKTYNGAIAVDTLQQPLGTLLEAAKQRGMLTGIVTTTSVADATPAAFTAHVPQRSMHPEIASQQVALRPDLIIGGGREAYVTEAEGGLRKDGVNLLKVAEEAGYHVVNEWPALRDQKELPVLSLLEMGGFPFEIDRDTATQPSLADLTRKTIELLSQGGRDFFVMIESAEIDGGGHSNDPAAALHETLAFDEALGVALDFAEKDGRTLVLVLVDHDTGGIMPGIPANGQDGIVWKPEVISRIRSSLRPMAEAIVAGADPREVLATSAGIESLTPMEHDLILAAGDDTRMVQAILSDIISRRSLIGWTTTGHTALDVNLYATGPGSRHFAGTFQNNEVGRIIARLMSFDLESLTRELRARTPSVVPAE